MQPIRLILFQIVLTASCLADVVPEGVLIDRVWSGHPVGFDIPTDRGHEFIAYFDSERRLTVKGRGLGDAKWTGVHPEGAEVARRKRMSNVTGWDSHNYLTMALDRDGCLHLSGNMHTDPLVYYRTSRPFDLTMLERIDHMTGDREQSATYPKFFTNDTGDLVFGYRDGGSGNGSDLYNIYDPKTRAWKRLFDGPLLDGEAQRSAYSLGPQRGPDGRFHLLWMWRDTPDAMTNHTLSYACSKDLIHWETSTGKPLARPITMAKAEVIDPAKPGEGLINVVQTLGFDHEKRPVVHYHRFDSKGMSQAFVARPDSNGQWTPKQISHWNFRMDFSGGGTQSIPMSLGAPSPSDDGSLSATFSTKLAGSGRWRIDGKSLTVLETLPPTKSTLPRDFQKPVGTFPGLTVRTRASQSGGDRWILRWETLGANRDMECPETPPPSELRLYQTAEPRCHPHRLRTGCLCKYPGNPARDCHPAGNGAFRRRPPGWPYQPQAPGNRPLCDDPKEWGVVLPFRWVEIEGWQGELLPKQVIRKSAYASTWDDKATSFESSDKTLNRIWELCRYSIKATTFAGVYVDGDRERIPSEADAYLNQLSHYASDNDILMARDTFDHLMKHPTWPTEWAFHMIFMAHADYRQSGDTKWLASRYESLKPKLLLDRAREDGLITSSEKHIKKLDLVDWPAKERDGYVFKTINTVVNAFHIRALKMMAEMATALGKDKDAADCTAMATKAQAAFQRLLFDPAKNAYRDGEGSDHFSQHASLFPLAFGLVPAEHVPAVADSVQKHGMACSVYAAQYLMEGLFANNAGPQALELITAPGDRSWRHMVESGTTITWEAWDQKYKPNQDWNHAWGAAPANLLPRFILGAEPRIPSWKQARIRPNPGTLTFAKGKIPTPRGPIMVDWKNESFFQMKLNLPAGMTAQLDLPAAPASKGVSVNGKSATAKRVGSRWLLDEMVSGEVLLQVN